ncbi:MAG: DUF3570 domain-containing protein [Planctomycetota bacterium]
MTAILAVCLGLLSGLRASDDGDSSVAFDLYAFRQHDGGGDPLRAEGFDYQGFRVAIVRRVDETYRLRVNGTLAFIDNEEALLPPPTVTNALTTSASPSLLTLDTNFTLDITPEHSPWTYSPGFYYHHQIEYIGTGLDFGIQRELLDGDVQVEARYSFRWDFLELAYWDQTFRGNDDRISHNTLFSWTQNLSPSTRGNLSFQYTRQDGFLSEPYNYVTLYRADGDPILFVDERLPNRRDRLQVNARLRWSPEIATALGLDTSYYLGSWGLQHAAVEPSAETELFAEWRLRLWYRLSFQKGARYFEDRPLVSRRFQTRDSDLGSFFMQSPGGTLTVPLGSNEEIRFSVYGFTRDDGVDGLGSKLGVIFRW